MSKVKDTAEEMEKFKKDAHASRGKSPMHQLLYIMSVAPKGVQRFIQMHVQEIIEIELAKLVQVEKGLELDPAGKDSVTGMFDTIIEGMKTVGVLDAEVTMTVQDCMRNIAEEIDRGVKRVLLGDKLVNTLAYLDIVSCHAKMTASLAHLMTVPKDCNGDST